MWACTRARGIKAQMKGRRIAKKQAMYARIAAGVTAVAVGKGKESTKGEDEEEEDEDAREATRSFEAPLSPSKPSLGTYRSSPQLPPLPLGAPTSSLGLELQFEWGYALPSPTGSYASSGSDTTAPRTPVTPMTPTTTPLIPLGSFHFPETRACVAPESPAMPATLGAHHLRRGPRARARFRTLSASITARSPLSLSFPLSFSLPLAARRASSPNVTLRRHMMGGEADRDGEGAARQEGEDPFGTRGSGYYAPGARAALGLGDAYDLSAWAWACDCSPHRRAKKRMRAAIVGSASVYRAPLHAASAPQLTYARHKDRELELSRVLADARTGTARERSTRVARTLGPASTNTHHESGPADVTRRGMRPLLLPQKLGLLTIGDASGNGRKAENEAGSTDSCSSGRRESKTIDWDVDLERGIYSGEEVSGV